MQYGQAWHRSLAFQREPGRSQLQTGPAPARTDRSERRPPRSRRQGRRRGSFQSWCVFLSFERLVQVTPTTVPSPCPLPPDGREDKEDRGRVEMRVSQGPRKEPTGAYMV